MKLSEIRQLVSEKGLRLTKSLGQNFLHDGNQLNRILEVAELTKSDKVLEIGPGLGPLTELLMRKAGEILAIEKDERLVQVLNERLHAGQAAGGTVAPLRLLHDDALEYLRREARDWTGWKVVSNLPYSVASPILVELAQASRGPERIVATLQIEVARRLMAEAGAEDYGLLTLLVQADYEPRGWFKIPASCFFPEPDVDSACVALVRRKVPMVTFESRPMFEKVVKRAFSQRRKMMMKLLREDWPAQQLERAFAALELPVQTRAETVTLEQFAALTLMLGAPPGDEIFDVVDERDEVIGRKSRAEVHRLGLMHRAVHVLVYDKDGRVFLQKRSMKKDRQPGLWDSSASGHVDAGETYDVCAVRELREEIGLEPSSQLQRLFKLAASTETDQEHVWVYRCEAEGPLRLDPDEIERGDWFAPAEVTNWLGKSPKQFASAFRVIWRRIHS